MTYTVCDVPIFSMTSAVTDQVQERVSIMSRNTMASSIAILLVTIAAPQLYLNIGWFKAAFVIAVPAVAAMFLFIGTGKERFINKNTDPVNLKSMLSFVRNNKFLLIFFSGLTLMNLTNTSQIVAAYFAAHCLGDPALTSAVIGCIALPALIIALFLPVLTRYFDKFHIFLFSSIANGVIGLVSYFIGYENRTIFFALLVLRGIFWGAVLITQLMFTGDIVEYGEFKTGKRLQGIAYSMQTFTFKLFNAVAAAGAMFILGFSGFMEGAGAIQGENTIRVIWILFTIFPCMGILVSMPVLLQYRLRDKDVQLMARCNSGEISREDAAASFSHSY
jgi:Na+/melibiose symporter-like transporter